MLQVEPIHVIGILVSLVLFSQSVQLVRTRRENILEFLLWIAFGSALLVYTVARMLTSLNTLEAINGLFRSLGFGSGERALLFLSVMTLFLLLLYTYTMVKTNRKEIADLQREIALLRYEIEQAETTDEPAEPPGQVSGRTDE